MTGGEFLAETTVALVGGAAGLAATAVALLGCVEDALLAGGAGAGETATAEPAVALVGGAEGLTATTVALLGFAAGVLLAAGAETGATATAATTLTLDTAAALDAGCGATEIARGGAGFTTATAGAGFSAGFVVRRAANCARSVIGLSLSSTNGGRSGNAASGTKPSVPLWVRTFTYPFTRLIISTVSPHFSLAAISKLERES